jgi:hypothetical protein
MSSNNVKFTVGNQKFEIVQRPKFKFDLLENGTPRYQNLSPGDLFKFFGERLKGFANTLSKTNELNAENANKFNTALQELSDKLNITADNHLLPDGSSIQVALAEDGSSQKINITFDYGTEDARTYEYQTVASIPSVWFWRLTAVALAGYAFYDNFRSSLPF